MGKKIKCKNNNKLKRLDAGYYDKYRGWYDVQECGRCNDYCRWVGNSGSGGNPAKRTRKKKKGKGKSWWSCRLGNKKKSYSNRNKWRNGFRYKKCIKEGAKSNLPLEGNKSKYGGGKRRKKTRRKRGGENDYCMAYNRKWWNTNGNNVLTTEQGEDLNKADKYCRNHANFENNPGGRRYFDFWKCQVSTGECFDEAPSLAPGRLTRTENATTFSSYGPDHPAAHVFREDDGFTIGGGRRRRTRRKPIRINPKMRGVFTKKAKKKGMSVQRYANYVIKKYKGKKKTKKQLKLLRQAVFAKTAKKWKKRKGGGKKRKAKDELRNIWRTSKRKRGNKDMNTTELMKAMNSPVKKIIKRNNEEFRKVREEWIKQNLQDGIYKFAALFKIRFGGYSQQDITVYDIKRRKSLNLKQVHPTPDKVIEDYMKNTDKARLKVTYMNNFINSANRDYRKKIKQNFWDDNPLRVKRYYENNKAMSQDSQGNFRKNSHVIHPSQQATGDFRGRTSPIPMAGDPEKTVSLVMTKADDYYFFNRPGG